MLIYYDFLCIKNLTNQFNFHNRVNCIIMQMFLKRRLIVTNIVLSTAYYSYNNP